WIRQPLDTWVLHRMEEADFTPEPEADRRTLLRRASLDLTGLPPTPEAMATFLADTDEGAYERAVDRLLESPHFGERWAQPWLDLARYADTKGYEKDGTRTVWPYRDWVIDALNDNMPFDQFTIEQIAGDLLPNPTIEQLVAASYSRLNQISREGGIQNKEYVKKYQSERVRTTATAWLGSTMACAECHDHKFDPFTTEDFYSMAAFFADILEMGAYTGDGSYQEDPEPYLTDKQVHEGWFGPELTVPNYLFQENPEAIKKQILENEKTLAKGSHEAEAEFSVWLENQRALAAKQMPEYVLFDYTEENINTTKTESLDVSSYPWDLADTAAIQFEARVTGGGGRGSLGLEVTYEAEGENFKRAYYFGDNYEGELTNKTDAPWRIQVSPKLYKGVWHPVVLNMDTLSLPRDAKLVSLLPLKGINGGFRNFRIRTLRNGSQEGELNQDLTPILAKAITGSASRSDLGKLKREYFINHAKTFFRERQPIKDLQKEIYGNRYTPLTISATPREVRVLPRGNWMDESGEIRLPATPGFLPGAVSSSEGKRLNRLDLAYWIVDRDNPLTARTFANRLWGQFFGVPLSNAPEDLGLQGEYPPYPELLDWLAAEFMESGWYIKQLVRKIVTSRTYRQTSQVSNELYEKDPYNRLLARQSPRRLPAEFIRDNALEISGLLNPKMGGTAIRPYQPAGFYRNLNFPRREYAPDMDDNQYRRGVYMHWQRTFLHPMLTAFDASGRDECVVKRELSNTPLQALNLLNDPTMVEAARGLAEILIEVPDDDQRIELAYVRALARNPTAAETRTLKAFLDRERQRFRENE
ncbi:MAG: DUF1553 domain-containing protein, partial [Verrucomicrobiae bacterium]|nr:DUF1553 domain-containing protein [Verrucomicrobiae bacterium]